MKNRILAGTSLLFTFLFTAVTGHAGLTEDLDTLGWQGVALHDQLTMFNFEQAESCKKLGTINTNIEDYLDTIETVTNDLVSPVTLTAEDLTTLNDLSAIAWSMGDRALVLSQELRSVEDVAELFEYRAGISAMLRLSDDIGKMSDRILEMADRILLMADNIGEMSDRILETQRIQNANIGLTQAAILSTQQNMVLLSDSLSSIGYNLTLGQLNSEAQALLYDMQSVVLTSVNMGSELERLLLRSETLLNKVTTLVTVMVKDSQEASHYISGNTLDSLVDLSKTYQALAFALENHADHINDLAPFTETPVLSDATKAMLRLGSDIGVMAGRMVEMSDKIIVMADNIGIMADRIVETQDIQLANMEMTKNSLLASQSITVTVIQNLLGQ